MFDETVPGLCVLPCTGLETSADGPASPVAPSTPDQVQLEIDLPAFYLHTSGSTGEFFFFLFFFAILMATSHAFNDS